jgi:hypothetical protein
MCIIQHTLFLLQRYSNIQIVHGRLYDIHCRIWRHCTPLLELRTRSTWVTHLATAPFQPFTFSVRFTKLLLSTFLKGLQRNMLVWLNGEHFLEKCLFLFRLVYYVYQFCAATFAVGAWHALCSCPFPFQPWLCDMRAQKHTQQAHNVVFIGVAPPVL